MKHVITEEKLHKSVAISNNEQLDEIAAILNNELCQVNADFLQRYQEYTVVQVRIISALCLVEEAFI